MSLAKCALCGLLGCTIAFHSAFAGAEGARVPMSPSNPAGPAFVVTSSSTSVTASFYSVVGPTLERLDAMKDEELSVDPLFDV